MSTRADRRSQIVIVGRPNISEERRKQPFTALDLEHMGSDSWFELIQGRLYETWPMGIVTSATITKLLITLSKHVLTHELGRVFMGSGFVLERDPDTVIAPRGAFLRSACIREAGSLSGFFPGSPDIAIEADSPLDNPADRHRKLALYERLPIHLLWWVDPEHRTVDIHRPGHAIERLTDANTLDGEDVVPGFSLPLASVFDF